MNSKQKPSDEFKKVFGDSLKFPKFCEKLVEYVVFLLQKQDALHERLEKLEHQVNHTVPIDATKRESMAEVSQWQYTHEKISNDIELLAKCKELYKDLVLKVIDESRNKLNNQGIFYNTIKKRIEEL